MRALQSVPTVLAEIPCKSGEEWRRWESNPRTTPTAHAPHELERSSSSRYVYFIQSGTNGPIKIGIASDPERRLRELQTAHYEDLRLLVVVPGDRKLELLFHEALADDRIGGEWFTASSSLLELIDSMEQIRTVAHDLAAVSSHNEESLS